MKSLSSIVIAIGIFMGISMICFKIYLKKIEERQIEESQGLQKEPDNNIAEKRKRLKELIDQSLGQKVGKESQELQALRDRYHLELIQIINSNSREFLDGVEKVSSNLTSMGGLCQLSYRMVMDEVKSISSTDSLINSESQKILGPTMDKMNLDLRNLIERLETDLNARQINFSKECNAEFYRILLEEEMENEFDISMEKNMELTMIDYQNAFTQMVYSEITNLTAAITLISSTSMIATQAIKGTLAKSLGHVFKKLGINTARSLGLATIDGPFPFADVAALIFEVGTISWAILEIKHQQKTIQKSVRKQMKSRLDKYKNNVHLDTKRIIDGLIDLKVEQNKGYTNSIKNSIS